MARHRLFMPSESLSGVRGMSVRLPNEAGEGKTCADVREGVGQNGVATKEGDGVRVDVVGADFSLGLVNKMVHFLCDFRLVKQPIRPYLQCYIRAARRIP
jgi:hypothetical protein